MAEAGFPRSEQEILNAAYIESLSALRTSANITANFEVENLDAADFRTSCFSGDAGTMRVSAMGVNITDVSNTDADDFRVSAFSDDGGTLRISGVTDDAAQFHVSAYQGGTWTPHIECSDANTTHVSAVQGDAGLFRISAVGGSMAFDGNAANNRVSCIQADASNLMISCRSDDAALNRVSAVGLTGLDISNSDAGDFHVSGYCGDANQLHVSAVQGDAGLFRVSVPGTVNVTEADASGFRTSASIMDVEYGGAVNVIVSARSVTPTSAMKGLLVNTVSPDAAFMRISAMGVNITDVSNPDAADFRVSAIQGDGALLRISALNQDANFMHVSAIGTVTANVNSLVGVSGTVNVNGIVPVSGTVTANVNSVVGVSASNLDIRDLDAVADSISAYSPNAAQLRMSAFSGDAAYLRVSALVPATVAVSGTVTAQQTAANALMVSCRSDDAALFHVSAVGTLTVSAHEVKQSDAASLRTSATITNTSFAATQSDAGSLHVSAFASGPPGYTIISKIQEISAAGETSVWTPAAGKSIYLTDVIITAISAANCMLYGAAQLTGKFFLAANGGVAMPFSTPLKLSANEVLGVSTDTVAGTLGVTFIGYEI